jgi:hypothetical protein
MKRSTINLLLTEAKTRFAVAGVKLPAFAFWTPDDWRTKGAEYDEIRDNRLGWDITDFGSGNFESCGLLLFTLRNGNYGNPEAYPKRYAEKIMIVKEQQITPMHFHWQKREDIINKGGGNLVLELYKADREEGLSKDAFSVSIDGRRRACKAGERVVLSPGESVCLEPYIYHAFYGERGKGAVILGEVSDVNDDVNDNRFLERQGRYPTIEEDEAPLHLLCTEYPTV